MHRQNLLLTLGLALIAAGFATPAGAKALRYDFAKLVGSADQIVVATVVDKFEDHGVTIARAVPKRTLKGRVLPELFFIAEPTWNCDSSNALKGETAVLFLNKSVNQEVVTVRKRQPTVVDPKPLYTLAGSGAGRWSIEWGGGMTTIILPTADLYLPKGVVDDPYKGKGSSVRWIPLNRMEAAIRRQVAQHQRSARK